MPFKVVTEGMKSLGLRGHTNIVEYPVGQWVRHENPIKGKCDEGGYWICLKLSDAKSLYKYMALRYGRKTRIFSVEVEDILFHSSYRAKVSAVRLVEEVLLCS